jgi:thioredoxin-like negative regulator of GroEL
VRPQVSPLGQESALLKRAVERRRHGDAAGALRALDELAQRFPDGQLARDARIVRVDALVALERRDEALGLLEQMPLDGTPRGDDLRLLRAELRAQRSCVGALPEFDRLVNRALPAALAERALVGRGLCRLRGGDAAGGRQDLERYLARFPEGRFAAAARAQLAAPRPGR